MALAFPEPDLWWLAYFALVPLLLLIVLAPSSREGAIRGWLGGAGFLMLTHHWLVPNTGPFLLLVALLVGLLWLPLGALAHRLLGQTTSSRQLLAALFLLPAGWVVTELVRSWEYFGGPFGLLGASQWSVPPMLAVAAIGGVWVVSFLVVMTNVALTAALVVGSGGMRLGCVAVAVLTLLVSPGYYLARGDPSVERSVNIATVQVGVIHDPQRRFEAGEVLTRDLEGRDVDLVVWGESSVGFDPADRPDLVETVQDLAESVGADVLINVDARTGTAGGIFKSALLISSNGLEGRYDKMRLVPFGEYIPLRPLFGWVAGITEAANEDRRRGQQLVLLESNGLIFGPLVCFESAFTDLSRSVTKMGAELIIYQSSTSTFQESWGPETHASLAAVRAVETGRSTVHATLTGATAAFDAQGNELARVGTDERGARVIEVPISTEETIYVRIGDVFPLLCLLAFVAALRFSRN
jgi:apolipoprotein N-acyltransferase